MHFTVRFGVCRCVRSGATVDITTTQAAGATHDETEYHDAEHP